MMCSAQAELNTDPALGAGAAVGTQSCPWCHWDTELWAPEGLPELSLLSWDSWLSKGQRACRKPTGFCEIPSKNTDIRGGVKGHGLAWVRSAKNFTVSVLVWVSANPAVVYGRVLI